MTKPAQYERQGDPEDPDISFGVEQSADDRDEADEPREGPDDDCNRDVDEADADEKPEVVDEDPVGRLDQLTGPPPPHEWKRGYAGPVGSTKRDAEQPETNDHCGEDDEGILAEDQDLARSPLDDAAERVDDRRCDLVASWYDNTVGVQLVVPVDRFSPTLLGRRACGPVERFRLAFAPPPFER